MPPVTLTVRKPKTTAFKAGVMVAFKETRSDDRAFGGKRLLLT